MSSSNPSGPSPTSGAANTSGVSTGPRVDPARAVAAGLRDELSRWFGRAVIVARGGETLRSAAELALERGNPVAAWYNARELLIRVPRSPVAMALAADAAEAAGLDEQACEPLTQLTQVVPWRGDVWLRLGLARQRIGEITAAREALGRALQSLDDAETTSRAALALAELDLAEGDSTRAIALLERALAFPESSLSYDLSQVIKLTYARALIAANRLDEAAQIASTLAPASPIDGPRQLVDGTLAAYRGLPAAQSLVRAFLLDTPGSQRVLFSYLARCPTEERTMLREVVLASGQQDHPLFRAALSEAEGDIAGANRALRDAAFTGDLDAAYALAVRAVEARDGDLLTEAIAGLHAAGAPVQPTELALVQAYEALCRDDETAALDALEPAGSHPWAHAMRTEIATRWIPRSGAVDMGPVIAQLRRAARLLDDVPTLLATEQLAVDAMRPLRIAILGEFNAGKSTFLNALLGVDLAPTGILPTTGTLHHVMYSPDPFARIALPRGPDRVVTHDRLRATLREIQEGGVSPDRVVIGAPLERLRSVEIIDTPGFNAPDPAHRAAALRAFDDLHVALWLLDAAQPLKDTERQMLSELQARDIPILVVINKIDRLPPDEQTSVVQHIHDSLAASSIKPLGPVLTVSARQALAARLNDHEALAASGWPVVENALSSNVIDRSAFWKDRVLRRRIRTLSTALLNRAAEIGEQEDSHAREQNSTARAWSEAAALLRTRSTRLNRLVERALEQPRKALAEDLAPLAGSDATATRSYTARRASHRLPTALAEAIVDSLEPIMPYRTTALAALVPSMNAAISGLVAGMDRPQELPDLPLSRFIDAIVEPAAFALNSGPPSLARPTPLGAPLRRRLAVLLEASSVIIEFGPT